MCAEDEFHHEAHEVQDESGLFGALSRSARRATFVLFVCFAVKLKSRAVDVQAAFAPNSRLHPGSKTLSDFACLA